AARLDEPDLSDPADRQPLKGRHAGDARAVHCGVLELPQATKTAAHERPSTPQKRTAGLCTNPIPRICEIVTGAWRTLGLAQRPPSREVRNPLRVPCLKEGRMGER